MKTLLLLPTLVVTHLVGCGVIGVFGGGPLMFLAAPALALFAWPFVVPEVIGVSALYITYQLPPCRTWRVIMLKALPWVVAGGIVTALFTPIEENHEVKWRVAGFVAGSVAALCAFGCVHRIKVWEEAAEPGATDNPDDARRVREDH